MFTVVEAKKGDIESGFPQCIAQMIAAEMFNLKDGTVLSAIYGAVTTGDVWRFLKLSGGGATLIFKLIRKRIISIIFPLC